MVLHSLLLSTDGGQSFTGEVSKRRQFLYPCVPQSGYEFILMCHVE